MPFIPGLAVTWNDTAKSFDYGSGVFGPEPEHRRLDAIRASLRDPSCKGPDPVYSIVMDVGRKEHGEELRKRNLLFGIVEYPEGQLGQEPVRSQGHVHAISPHSGWSAPELFEVWEGHAIIYAQQYVEQDPGLCIAIAADPGDQVVVPPGWAHCVINADPDQRMIFVACCDREYGFVYDNIRSRGGLAWFPTLSAQNQISWEPNPRYHRASLMEHRARSYRELDLVDSISIYQQFARRPDSLQWVSEPALYADVWPFFIP